MRRKLANFALFQVGWFTCVLGAGAGREWLGPLVVLVILALHLTLVERRWSELVFLLVAGALGTLLDSLQAWLGAVEFGGSPVLRLMCPLWITALWFAFSTTLNVSLGWIHRRYVLAAILGALAGPLTYYGASQLGAVAIPNPGLAAITVGIEYAVALPLLMAIAASIRPSLPFPAETDRRTDVTCGPET